VQKMKGRFFPGPVMEIPPPAPAGRGDLGENLSLRTRRISQTGWQATNLTLIRVFSTLKKDEKRGYGKKVP